MRKIHEIVDAFKNAAFELRTEFKNNKKVFLEEENCLLNYVEKNSPKSLKDFKIYISKIMQLMLKIKFQSGDGLLDKLKSLIVGETLKAVFDRFDGILKENQLIKTNTLAIEEWQESNDSEDSEHPHWVDNNQIISDPPNPSKGFQSTSTQFGEHVQEEYDDEPAIRKSETSSKKFKILSIDGGGIRGIIPAMILAAIENELKDPMEPVVSLASYFNLMVGTSTGGIISLGLARPPLNGESLSAADIVKIYSDHGSEIFPQSRLSKVKQYYTYKYDPSGLENVLNEYFGSSTIGQALTEVVVPTFCLNDSKPYFIDSVDYKGWLMRDAARCTSAAPTFFPPAEVNGKRFIDGGVFANNPTVYAYARAIGTHSLPLSDLYVVSLGTGSYTQPLDQCDKGIICKGGNLTWASKIFGISSKGRSEVDHLITQGLFAKQGGYRRIPKELKLEKKIDLDDVSTTSDLTSIGREVISKYSGQLHKICNTLRQ